MDIKLIKTIRQETGASFSDCKKALKEANGDLDKAIIIANELFSQQKDMEQKDSENLLADTSHKHLQSTFNDYTKTLKECEFRRRRSAIIEVCEKIINTYELGLSVQDKKKFGVQSTILTPVITLSPDIISEFIKTFVDLKQELLVSNGFDQTSFINSIENALKRYGDIKGDILCIMLSPVLFSTSIDLTEGYEIYRTECQEINDVFSTINSDSWYDSEVERYSESGVDLNLMMEQSNSSFLIEGESPNGDTEYYLSSQNMQKKSNGCLRDFGVNGEWVRVCSRELKKLTDLHHQKRDNEQIKKYIEIIDLFIDKIS
jgi:hypothetical protein